MAATLLALLATGIHAVYVAPSGQFNATENVSFNWTAGTINITSNYTNLVIYVDNSSTSIAPTYFTTSDYPTGSYAGLTSDAGVRCFGAAGSVGTKFYIINSTGSYENTTRAMNTSQYTVFSLYAHPECPPGKYYGNFSVKNVTNSSDYLSVTATVNVPISTSNTIDGNKTGYFKGSITSAGYHSYYLWTNATTNVTSVAINLTGLTGDVDLFILDSQGRLLNKSLSTGTTNESMDPVRLPSTADAWEIRIGNATSSYTGYLHYSTLNSSTSALNFGVLGPNQTSSTSTYSLSNLASFPVSNVSQSVELYKVHEWKGISTAGNFQIVVPAFAQKVSVRIEWNNETGKNMTDWDLYLRDANQALLSNSTNKSLQAIGVNVSAEETITYTGTISEANDGFWNITVSNATSMGTLCSFNLTARVWMNASQWIFTNFTQVTFNQSGALNSSYAVTANVSVPRWNLTGGSYAGSIRYSNGSGWAHVIPISLNVSAGTLIVNGNLSNSTYRLEDNIGINRTGASALQISIPINNTGNAPVYLVNTTPQTSGSLINAIYPTRYMNMTASSLSSPVIANSNATLTITVTINTTETANTQDIYRGWVFFNTTNALTNLSSYPYETYNLTLEINLSNSLNVTVTSVTPGQVLNITAPNITVTASVKLMNGSVISNTGIMDNTNFTIVTITERNVSSYTNSTTTIGNAGAVTCAGGVCSVNATLPSNLVGGNYTVALTAKYGMGGVNLTGSGTFQSVLINNTGLYIESVAGDSLGEVGETRTTYANFTVTNYGMKNATNAHVIFNKGDCPITVTTYSQGCSSTTSGATYTTTIGGNSTQCWYNWKIVANNITGTTTCSSLSVTISDYATLKNSTSLSLQINNLDTTTSTSNPGMSGSSCSTSSNCVWNYKCVGGSCTLIQCSDTDKHIVDHDCIAYLDKVEVSDHVNLSATLGSYTKTTIKVKNTGDRTMKAKLNVTTSEGLTASVTPSDCPLTAGAYCYFTVNFSVSGTASIGKQKCHYTAYSMNKTSVNNAQFFYFDVLPTDDKKNEIDTLYASYSVKLKDELGRLTLLKLSLSADNASKIEALLNETRDLLGLANTSISAGDYATAENKLTDVNATFRRVTSMLEAMGVANITPGLLGIPTWIWMIVAAIAVVIIVVAVVVYMLLPPKGYSTAYKAYVKPDGPGVGERISRALKKGMKRFKKDDKFAYKYKP